jgi:hypothetical protein
MRKYRIALKDDAAVGVGSGAVLAVERIAPRVGVSG